VCRRCLCVYTFRPDVFRFTAIEPFAFVFVSVFTLCLSTLSYKETSMNKLFKMAGVAACALFLATAARAEVAVEDAWVRATVAQQNGTGAFMRLTASTDSALVEADSPVAKHVEVHEMAMENNVMKMRQVPSVKLPAGQTVELKPGSYHIMLIDLHEQVKVGQNVPLKLTFEDAAGKRSTVDLEVPVRPLSTPANGGSHGHGHDHGHGAPKH
jgi:copper(I)-binding protein